MRFPQDGRAMAPFWALLTAQLCDAKGTVPFAIQPAPPEVGESFQLELRGALLRFDDLEDLFSMHLGDDVRLVWTLDVEVDVGVDGAGGRVACAMRVDVAKRVAQEAVVGTYPRPSFYIRAAITLADRSVLSRWHIDWSLGFEDALADLRAALPGQAVHACYFCKWSDYEPSTTTGHLGCFRAVKPEYEAIATSPDALVRKYRKESLYADRVWVDELNVCDQFTKRPVGFGYRG
jgi:hypothetical protein